MTGTFSCGQQMLKYGYTNKAVCTLCKKAHEENGGSWNEELPKETIGHIQVRGVWGRRKWSPQLTMRASGSCYKV